MNRTKSYHGAFFGEIWMKKSKIKMQVFFLFIRNQKRKKKTDKTIVIILLFASFSHRL